MSRSSVAFWISEKAPGFDFERPRKANQIFGGRFPFAAEEIIDPLSLDTGLRRHPVDGEISRSHQLLDISSKDRESI